MTDQKEKKNQTEGAPGQLAARDTTFDGVVPQRLWIGVTNMKGDGKLHVIAEINGIEKSIFSIKPSYAEPNEGMINDYSNLTWVLNSALTELQSQMQSLQKERDRMKSALEKIYKNTADYETEKIAREGLGMK